jgi:hypothetical protein
MSIKATYGIKRDIAIKVIRCYLTKLSDRELKDILEILPESYFRNYSVNGTGYSNDNKSFIGSVEEFFYK